MIDEKGRLFGKLNLLDLILIVLFLAIIVFACFFFAGNGSGGGTIPVTYTIEIQNQDEAYFNHVIIGETVTDGMTGSYLGKISGFEKKPAQVVVQADDELIIANPEGKFDGYVEIQADAKASYPDMILGGEPLKIGTSVAYRSETLAMHGFIVEIDYDLNQLKGVQ